MTTPPPILRLLCSYYHWRAYGHYLGALCDLGCDVILDSGAFSAHTMGEELRVEEYADFLAEHQGRFAACFTLDRIGDPEGSRLNHLALRRRGYDPIPVWQGHDAAFPGLDAFLDGEPYVALGGLVKTPKTSRPKGYNERRILSFMRAVRGRSRVHLLGYSRLEQLRRFAPFSCDSSSFTQPFRYGGSVPLHDPRTGAKLASIPFNEQPRSLGQLNALRTVAPRFNPREWVRKGSGGDDTVSQMQKGAITLINKSNLYRAAERHGVTRIYLAVIPVHLNYIVTGLYLSNLVRLEDIENAGLAKYLRLRTGP